MAWLLFFVALEVGYLPETHFQEHYNPVEYTTGFYMQAEPEIVFFDKLHVKGTIHIDMLKHQEKTFDFIPLSLVSTVNIFYQYKFISLGFIWKCGHPVAPWGNNNLPGQDTDHHYKAFYLRFTTKE